ncbi:hypothetical protein BKA63DRAFT_561874 [Paraphoma chrysanthemicola]|nr:hypothetical protein BKA63DRAFT_561874 [Paraphoma chrysanthemicola]
MPDLPSPLSNPERFAPRFRGALEAPSPDGRSTNSQYRHEDLLEQIEEHQEDLRDAREVVVGSRFRLRTKRQELRATRETASSQSGSAFTLIRKFLLEQKVALPQQIEYAMEDAETWRDRLGEREVDYELAEEQYNRDEWNYTEREKKFVEDIFVSMRGASSKLTPLGGSAQDLTSYSIGVEMPEPHEYAPDITDVGNLAPDITLDYSNLSATMFTQDDYAVEPETNRARLSTSHSLYAVPNRREQQEKLLTRPYSETDLAPLRFEWSDTRKRIEGWLLEALEGSKVQQAQLWNVLSSSGVNDKDWWQLVIRNWASDSPGNNPFHTGDTTASDKSLNSAASADTMRKSSNDPGKELEEGPSSASPLISLDRVVDALESFDFPRNIEPHDLVDPAPAKHVTFMMRSQSARSMSTQPTAVTRSSSGLDFSSMSSVEEDLSYVSSADADTIRPEEPVDKENMESESPLGSLETQHGQTTVVANDVATTHPGVQQADIPVVLTEMQSDTQSSADIHFDSSKSFPLTPETLPTDSSHLDHAVLQQMENASSVAKEELNQSIPTRNEDVWSPPTPFIPVKSPEPWSLPLLRLTPLPTPKAFHPLHSSESHNLENIPFVLFSDNPFRLPGPWRLPESFLPDFSQ